VIYEHGKPSWNYIDRGKLLILIPELSSNPTSKVIYYKSRNTGEVKEFVLKIFSFSLLSFTSLPKEVALRILIALKNPSPSAGFEPETLGAMASTLSTIPPRTNIKSHSIIGLVKLKFQ
jgi:hypothetical protein